jgi:hypothetical protein
VIVQDRNKPIARILPFTLPLSPEGDHEAEIAYLIATGQRRLAAAPIPKEADDKAGLVTPGLNDISKGLGETATIKPVLLTEFDGKIS